MWWDAGVFAMFTSYFRVSGHPFYEVLLVSDELIRSSFGCAEIPHHSRSRHPCCQHHVRPVNNGSPKTAHYSGCIPYFA